MRSVYEQTEPRCKNAPPAGASALVCILLYFALLFATRAGLSYYNNHSDIQQRSIARQVERFQKYVTAQEISAKDTRAIDDWVGQQSFC